ncbi:MAG: DUF4124 domain-containing protein [Gammaproteobacteria bacterium]
MSSLKAFVCTALLGVLAACPALASEEVYRSVDKDGRPVFSDRPTEGSSPVDVRTPNTMRELAPPPAPASTPGAEQPGPPVYRMLRISNLENGGSVTNPAGNIVAEIELVPALQPGHRLQGILDGDASGMPSGAGWLFPGTARGPHSVEVQVLDASGQPLMSSGAMTVTVFRPVPRQKRSGGAP